MSVSRSESNESLVINPADAVMLISLSKPNENNKTDGSMVDAANSKKDGDTVDASTSKIDGSSTFWWTANSNHITVAVS